MKKIRTPEDNSNLDYTIAESLGITIDELDKMPLSYVENLRDKYNN